VPGTGQGGRISKQDIEAYISGGPAASASDQRAKQTEPAEADVYTQRVETQSVPAPQSARAPQPPPPPPTTTGGQHHVAFESAVPRERMYFGNYEVQPMSVMRQRIAEHMIASKHVSPHVYSVDEIDMSKVAALRAKSKDEF